MKKCVICCDIEGVTGVTSYNQAIPCEPLYLHGKRMLENDLATVCRGLNEDFVFSIRRLVPYPKRVHLGNGVTKPWGERYGGTHSPMDFPNGSIGEAELVIILKALLDIGFLVSGGKSGLMQEMTPYSGISPEETMEKSFALLDRVLKKI